MTLLRASLRHCQGHGAIIPRLWHRSGQKRGASVVACSICWGRGLFRLEAIVEALGYQLLGEGLGDQPAIEFRPFSFHSLPPALRAGLQSGWFRQLSDSS